MARVRASEHLHGASVARSYVKKGVRKFDLKVLDFRAFLIDKNSADKGDRYSSTRRASKYA
jgi:hypothetical protein